MADATNFRRERIEKLLHELRYEVERGMMERDIDETLNFEFTVPISNTIPSGIVRCLFQTRPTPRHLAPWNGSEYEPRLKVVK